MSTTRWRWQALVLLFLHPPAQMPTLPHLPTRWPPPSPPPFGATAQRQTALRLHLASDCTLCLTVDSTPTQGQGQGQGLGGGEFEFGTEPLPIQTSDCATTPPEDQLWLLAQDAQDGGGWWCLASNPALCVAEEGQQGAGGTASSSSSSSSSRRLWLAAESETDPDQQFAYGDELRTATEGSPIVGGGSGGCVTLVTGGGVRMNDCAANGGRVGQEGIGMARQRWRAVEEGKPLCPDGETDGDGGGDGGGNGGSAVGGGGGGGGGFLGDETTLPDPSRILLFLESDCNQCLGVDDVQPDAPLKLVSCKDTPAILQLWSLDLLVGSSIAQSVCLDFDPTLCLVETDDGQLRLGDGRSTIQSAAAYILNQFIDDQIESLEEVGQCLAFVGGDGTLALQECSPVQSGQYWTKQGEAYWTETCANTPPPSPRPTSQPTGGPAPPGLLSEEVPWWTIVVVVVGSILVGGAVYYAASACLSRQRRKREGQRRRRRRDSHRSGPSHQRQQSPGIS